ncbi:MAG: transcription elongation factor GreA [Bacteroidetes bacterium]|nr:transcription elongation factor GreA [Bacteroidota bacterium]
MSQTVYVTEEGLKKLKDKLHQLKTVERPKASRAIAEARDKGDLSENAEYDAAKDAQGMLELEISKLEDAIANARVLDESKIDASKVTILSTVRILNHNTSKEIKYSIVAEQEADLKLGKISVSSPIGKGLLGCKVGDIANVQVPAGVLKLEVLEITR